MLVGCGYRGLRRPGSSPRTCSIRWGFSREEIDVAASKGLGKNHPKANLFPCIFAGDRYHVGDLREGKDRWRPDRGRTSVSQSFWHQRVYHLCTASPDRLNSRAAARRDRLGRSWNKRAGRALDFDIRGVTTSERVVLRLFRR